MVFLEIQCEELRGLKAGMLQLLENSSANFISNRVISRRL